MSTVLTATRTAMVAAISAQVPTVRVSRVPLAEDTPLKEAIWVERSESEFDWRSLGAQPTHATRNRSEEVTHELRVHVYREGHDQTVTAQAVQDRCDDLFEEVEQAFEADFSLSGVATHSLPVRWSQELRAVDKGWVADGRVTVLCTNYPT